MPNKPTNKPNKCIQCTVALVHQLQGQFLNACPNKRNQCTATLVHQLQGQFKDACTNKRPANQTNKPNKRNTCAVPPCASLSLQHRTSQTNQFACDSAQRNVNAKGQTSHTCRAPAVTCESVCEKRSACDLPDNPACLCRLIYS